MEPAPRFHLSIPVDDLDATEAWYVEGLGCRRGRRSDHALILDLGGHQLVAQRTPGPQPVQAGIYPRHFGLVFASLGDFEALAQRASQRGLRFGMPPKRRFVGTPLEHHTLFLVDPSGNWLEFKWYNHPDAITAMADRAEVGDHPSPGAP